MELGEYTKRVNEVAESRCRTLNANGLLFRATHYAYPAEMLKLYFDQGLTPEEADAEIQADA